MGNLQKKNNEHLCAKCRKIIERENGDQGDKEKYKTSNITGTYL